MIYLFLVQGGQFYHLNDPDIETIKTRVGNYHNYFAKDKDIDKDVNDVVFTVPYIDYGELGKHKNYYLLILLIQLAIFILNVLVRFLIL